MYVYYEGKIYKTVQYRENLVLYNAIMTDVSSKSKIVIYDLRQPWFNNRRVAELKAAFECQRSHHFIFANTHYVPHKTTVKHTDELAAEVYDLYLWGKLWN
jgi:hypothetical protein